MKRKSGVDATLQLDELNSAIFLIKQFKLTNNQDQSLCNQVTTGTVAFKCATDVIDGITHVTEIMIPISPNFDAGEPDYTLTSFTFPNLTNIQVTAGPRNQSIDILTMFMGSNTYPVLKDLYIVSDYTTSLAPEFSTNMPELTTLQLRLGSLTSFDTFFLSGPKLNYASIFITSLTKFPKFAPDSVYPKLATLNIVYSPNNDTFFIPKQHFPILRALLFYVSNGNEVHFKTDLPLGSAGCVSLGGDVVATCDINLLDTSKTTILYAVSNTTINPPVSASSPYPELTHFSYQYGKFKDFYPIQTFPPKMSTLSFSQNLYTSIPDIVLPASVKEINFLNNPITGTIDYVGPFVNTNNMKLVLDSSLVTGTVPDSFCNNRLDIVGTSIAAVPDCFWCYSQTYSLITTLPKPPGFTCQPSFVNASMLVTNMGVVTAVGQFVGWGNGEDVKAIVPNKIMEITKMEVYNQLGPPVNYTLTLQREGADVLANVTLVEGSIRNNMAQFFQLASQVYVTMNMIKYNTYFTPIVRIHDIDCTITIYNETLIGCLMPPMQSGPTPVVIGNGHYSRSHIAQFIQTFPILFRVTQRASPGTNITIFGNYGNATQHIAVLFGAGTSQETDCAVLYHDYFRIVCAIAIGDTGVYGNTSVLVNINGFTDLINTTFLSAQEICIITTNYCHGNGQCQIDGTCLCKQQNFYQNCQKSYPIINAGEYDSNDTSRVTLYGDFGPLSPLSATITLNNSITCTSSNISTSFIKCTLSTAAPLGLSSVQITINGFNTTVPNIIRMNNIDPNNGNSSGEPGSGSGEENETSQQKCSRLTFNCYGNGKCDTNGKCQCNTDYNPIDNCFTKFINTTIIANSTSPTVSFDIDGIDFQFEFKSIQELDIDDNVLNQLNIDDYSWNVNVSTNNLITIANYQLNTTSSTLSFNNEFNPFQSLQVTSTISFASFARDVQFGDQILQINPNSIKLAVNVSGWQYSSNVATLRIIFTSIINTNQSVEFNCKENEIEPTVYDSLSSLQYLKVVKDDLQFNGRFIDFALSDGRVVYSKTELVSFTPVNDDESLAMIGIRLPQCQQCVLDPDFTPLLIDKSHDQGCDSSSSKAWRIGVGVSVGVVGAIAIATTTIILVDALLPLDELNSAIFLIKQFKLVSSQDQLLCNQVTGIDIVSFKCATDAIDGITHITEIEIASTLEIDAGEPDYTLTSFTFPNLTNIRLRVQPRNQSIDIVAMFMGNTFPVLKQIDIYYDYTTTLSSGFGSNMPELTILQMTLGSLTSFDTFFLNLPVLEYVSIDAPLWTKFPQFAPDSVYPKLNTISNVYSPNNDTFFLSKQNLPVLDTFSNGNEVHLTTDIPLGSVGCKSNMGPMGLVATCDINLLDPSRITFLNAVANTTLNPPVSSSYYRLAYYTYGYGNLHTIYPIQSFPPNLLELKLDNNQYTSIPNVVLPPSSILRELSFLNNPITGAIDFVTPFVNTNNMKLSLDSNLVTGTVPDSFCNNRLAIVGTSITSVPDCFWCYGEDLYILSTSLTKPLGFTCQPSIENASMLVTRMGVVTVTGQLVGWGNGVDVRAIVPNKLMVITKFEVYDQLGPPVNYTLTLQTTGEDVLVNVTLVEGWVHAEMAEFVQLASQVQVSMVLSKYNTYFTPIVKIHNIDCNLTSLNESFVSCLMPPMQSGPTPVFIGNGHYNLSHIATFTQVFPKIFNSTLIASPGTNITIKGYFGDVIEHIAVTIGVGTSKETDCAVLYQDSTAIVCAIAIGDTGVYVNTSVLVNINGFTELKYIPFNSKQENCQQTTNYCHGNGQCQIDGTCLCKQQNFYQDCQKSYPRVSAGEYDSNDTSRVTLYGDFGPSSPLSATITLNNSITCTPSNISTSFIKCTLSTAAPFGLSSVQVISDNNPLFNMTVLNIIRNNIDPNNGNSSGEPGSGEENETSQQKCSRLTFNCYGNGKCDTNGKCQCNTDYNPIDNCFTKFINTTIIANSTSPTVSFDIDGIDFQFEFKSIQELDIDDNVLNQLNIDDYSWNVNVSTNNLITIANYQLNTTSSTLSFNNEFNPFQSLQVTSTISFASFARDVQFGDQILQINPNSIKLAVNVSGWQFSSNVATLRLIFTSIVNNNQSIQFNCQETEIGTLSFDSMSSLQYLRVVRDNIQFSGRFIDFALSDGRVVYSKTELVSFTPLLDNSEQAVAMIGIRLPQCQQCVLDPDFTPLLIDKSHDQGCDSSSNAWKIAVGVSLGVVGAIAITVASILYYKKKRANDRFNKNIQNKLRNFVSIGKGIIKNKEEHRETYFYK
ncbi:hypothetical protein DFA_00518 [Cavenderia fasciculata]|uniref:ComC supersandwich domain-containing protein n=1 Tax=Cavenderia fasciculata TaxID=261658 RepID=F4PSB1_CACFS|nr:uncharacterized protein DFA_00518 [Cavenderia fasciculata]EGG20657.1 hypothetical protein DFA_00518 [Cavenderia fasciculata]|eukprot:XP_004358507.1 hypothetical protein DFA_00518 [Cavenderia fasciculata]